MDQDKEFETPMMKQYMEIKNMYSDCLVLFRLGDFYELFLRDAKIASGILDITLTSRSRGKDGRIPMAGVPYHALDSYLFKLVKAGYKVAICEQVGDVATRDANGEKIVERKVVRVVTPGTVLEESSLDKKENNYIAGIHIENAHFGLAIADISTGFFYADQHPLEKIQQILADEFSKFLPKECVLSDEIYNDAKILKIINETQGLNIFPYSEWNDFALEPQELLERHFGVVDLDGFGLGSKNQAQQAAAGLLAYLRYTQKNDVTHIKKIQSHENKEHMLLDRSTIVNLELFRTVREGHKKGSLIHHLDRTSTAMGGRLLRNWLLHPLINNHDLGMRYDSVQVLLESPQERTHMKEVLSQILDIERLLSRLAVGIGNPRDLVNLKLALNHTKELKESISRMPSKKLRDLAHQISPDALNVSQEIAHVMVEEPPIDPKIGGIINDGINNELDKLRDKIHKSKNYISDLETTERQRTGINSLKVRFNQVFGYYIDITKSNLSLVPENYIRKQTLVNSERFITPELKEHEEVILTAEEKVKEIEYTMFCDVVSQVLEKTEYLQKLAQAVAEIDCLSCFADIAYTENYCRPELVDTGEIQITNGRHPVVEKLLDTGDFVPNDTLLNRENHQLLIITGPNMAGKSVYIRQVALIVLLAQTGSFVPAEYAKISLVDKLFVRSGASDVITSGLSTFMVEMVETANILNNATKNSLIVMDEIGRGTSTYDGISIAWSVAEYLVTNSQPKTLFATHYHELQSLEEKFPDKIKNYQVVVEGDHDNPVFLHKVKEGGADHSFGITVAKLAGVPEEVCNNALEILAELKKRTSDGADVIPVQQELLPRDLDFEIFERLRDVDISNITPLEALNILAELKRI